MVAAEGARKKSRGSFAVGEKIGGRICAAGGKGSDEEAEADDGDS